jgi:polysaccharide biosynthesis protein PslH
MARVLFVTDQFPYPLHGGGNLRTFHVLAGLMREHEVTILAHRPEVSADVLAQFPLRCRVDLIDRPRLAARVWAGIRQRGRHHRSLLLVKNWSSPMLLAVAAELRRTPYDAIHWNHLDTACYSLAEEWAMPQFFDTHNCLSELARQASGNAKGWWRKRVYSVESKQLQRAEAAVCQRMRSTITCSQVDASLFQKLSPTASFRVVPNGVDTNYFCPMNDDETEPGALVFTGAMNYFPNAEGILSFCHATLPLVSNRSTKLYVVGNRPTARVLALHDGRRITVTGEVDDVRPYLKRGQVVVVPLQHGSGTRLKILEAMAAGKAIVSTSIGAEGIPVKDGEHLLLADEPSAMAGAIDRLLADAALRREIGKQARRFVVEQFDWSAIQSAILAAYRTIT